MDLFNDPIVGMVLKGGLLALGGLLLKKWPVFVNKAIPVTLGFLSFAAQVIHEAWPALVPAAHAALGASQEPVHGFNILGFIAGTVLPAVCAVGLHSWSKNTRQWAEFGWRLFHPEGYPPTA